jgi:type III restriction enzyme
LKFSKGDDLYSKSGNIQEYKGYKIAEIDGLHNLVRFTNEKTIKVGETIGNIDEKNIKKNTNKRDNKAHINKEKILFEKGIKTISLFFH